MTILAVSNKFFKELIRTKFTFVLLFIFPFFFLFIFNVAFGGTNIAELQTYRVSIVNLDTGIPDEAQLVLADQLGNITEIGFGQDLVNIIDSLAYEKSDQPIFNTSMQDLTEADLLLGEEQLDVVMIIPENYSLALVTRINLLYGNLSIPGLPTDINATVTMIANDNNSNAPVAKSVLSNIIAQYVNGIDKGIIPDQITINENTVLQGETFSIFDFIASGLFVFGSILTGSLFSAMLLSDWQSQVIRRVKIAEIKAHEYILGYVLITFIFMQIQNIFLFAAAYIFFGFTPQGSFLSGYFVMFLTSIATYALIFTAAALVKSADAVGGILGFGSSILGFASNAFFPMPDVVLVRNLLPFSSGSPHLLLWDVFPWTHAVNALRGIFLFGLSLQEVIGDLVLLLVLSIFWFVISIALFMRKRLQMEDA